MKKTLMSMLPALHRELLNRCVAWHIRPHRLVFLEGLAAISRPLRFDGMHALEIGATARSTVSPFLVARGAKAVVTCYPEKELPGLNEALSLSARRYGLMPGSFRTQSANICAWHPEERFDLIVMKAVLGGVNRRHDQNAFRQAVENCLSLLKHGGHLLIIDKAPSYKVIQTVLKRVGAAGRHHWHYFTVDELRHLAPEVPSPFAFSAHGVLSFGDLGGGMVQKIADFLDEHFLEKFVPPEKRCVFSALYTASDGMSADCANASRNSGNALTIAMFLLSQLTPDLSVVSVF